MGGCEGGYGQGRVADVCVGERERAIFLKGLKDWELKTEDQRNSVKQSAA